MLAQFAQLGSAYAEVAFGITSPRVGLLSIGAEPGKGNKLVKRAYELLSADPQHGAAPINFTGNVEGCDLLAGKVDVIVTEGFAGNVALKTLEGTAAFTAAQFMSALQASRMTRLGAALQRKELRELKERLDAETYGGAALIGLEGTVVIAHGAASERGAAAACRMAAELASGRIAERDQGAARPEPGQATSSAEPDGSSPAGAGPPGRGHYSVARLDRLKHGRSAGRAGGGRERGAYRRVRARLCRHGPADPAVGFR